MTAYLIVRAEVPAADREDFDRWYEKEHLPDALAAFSARSAWRGWSESAPGAHYAWYEFDNLDAASSIADSDAIKALIAEFDRTWEGRITRTRNVVECRQRLGGD